MSDPPLPEAASPPPSCDGLALTDRGRLAAASDRVGAADALRRRGSAGRALVRLADALWQVLVVWWQVDRVRSSPREGQLLRLPVGTVLCIAGELGEVLHRQATELAEGYLVCYTCRAHDGVWELRITVPHPVDAAASRAEVWIRSRDGRQQRLAAHDIEIWSTAGRRKRSIGHG